MCENDYEFDEELEKLVNFVKKGLDNLVNVYYNRSITRKMTALR